MYIVVKVSSEAAEKPFDSVMSARDRLTAGKGCDDGGSFAVAWGPDESRWRLNLENTQITSLHSLPCLCTDEHSHIILRRGDRVFIGSFCFVFDKCDAQLWSLLHPSPLSLWANWVFDCRLRSRSASGIHGDFRPILSPESRRRKYS